MNSKIVPGKKSAKTVIFPKSVVIFGRKAIATAERVGFTDIGSGRWNVTTSKFILMPTATNFRSMATEIMTLIPKEIAGTTW